MLPPDQSQESSARSEADELSAQVVASSDAALGEDDGITFWRGFDPASVPTGVFLARARAAPGTRIRPHWHSQDTIAYLLDGRAVFRSGSNLEHVHTLHAGDWLFVPAGLVHVEETPDDVHGDFLYARDGGGGSTTYVSDHSG